MTIEVLFPEVANLYGDLGNIEYITRSLEACGKTCEVIDTDLYTRPAFADRDDIDLIYMGPVTEKGQLRVIDSLKPYKDRLEQLILVSSSVKATCKTETTLLHIVHECHENSFF